MPGTMLLATKSLGLRAQVSKVGAPEVKAGEGQIVREFDIPIVGRENERARIGVRYTSENDSSTT